MPERDEVRRDWGRSLQYTDLHDLYTSPPAPQKQEMVGYVAIVGKRRDAYRILLGKPEGKIPLERPRHRWEENIKLGLKEIGLE